MYVQQFYFIGKRSHVRVITSRPYFCDPSMAFIASIELIQPYIVNEILVKRFLFGSRLGD